MVTIMGKQKPVDIELSFHSVQSEKELDREYNIRDLTAKCPKCNCIVEGGALYCDNCGTSFAWDDISTCDNGDLIMVNDGVGGKAPIITLQRSKDNAHLGGRCPDCGCFVYDVSDVCFNCGTVLSWKE